MKNDHAKEAKVFKAFCDEKRVKIIELLTKGEMCACAIMEITEMAQSALSYHMKILCESGIVTPRQEGKWTFYSLNQEGIKTAVNYLLDLVENQ